ncbi:MAG: molecular chaperone DnaJ [Armatimonadetes bacterium]|nr:molecular chaperone DnaJ [Armatimonadota bacterium]
MKRDYYEVLGIRRDATEAEVRQAFRRLAKQLHPDANSDDAEAEERFKELNEAYAALSDPERRARYDRFGHESTGAGEGGFDFGTDLGGTIFEWVFGGGSDAAHASRGRDLRVDITLTLKEAARGGTRTINVTRLEWCDECHGTGAASGARPETCPTCRGAGQVRILQNTFLGAIPVTTTCQRCQGRGEIIRRPCSRCGGQGRARRGSPVEVTIPAGVDNGMRIHIRGQGEAAPRGGARPGDLWVYIHVRPHPAFQRQGCDLLCEAEVSLMRAALGGTLEVPTLDGSERMRIPPGAQPGDQFRLRGRGLLDPTQISAPPGDLLVVLRVTVPRKLNERQRQLLRELAVSLGEELDEPPQVEGEGSGLFEWVRNIFGSRSSPRADEGDE